jgi:hypothetical protein
MNMSAPPGSVDIKDPRIRVTLADVAMRFAHDGPMYGVIVLVGILAIGHNIDSIHAIIGAAFALQARSRPPAENEKALTRSFIGGGVALFTLGALQVVSCAAPPPVALYGPGLVICNEKAKTCEESIRCENDLRKANNRPLRDIDAGCQ